MTSRSGTLTKTAARKLPLNQRIVWARRRKGISQERLASMIGTSRRHMVRLEGGQHRPGPNLRARIAVATEQPEAFFEDDEDDPHVPIDELLRRHVRQLVREERGRVA